MSDHVLQESYERLGDENMVVVRCTCSNDIVMTDYYWPSEDAKDKALATHLKELNVDPAGSDPDLDSRSTSSPGGAGPADMAEP